jgi:Kef-type K+ transport system membrane component KefB
MESIIEVLTKEPIVPFAILLVVILTVPYAFERIRLPGLVGLLAAGVALGPHGLRLLNHDSETMKLLADIGLVYLMFVAGLEIDMQQFRQTKFRSMGYGSLGFIVPLIMGAATGRLFGFGWDTSILIGSLFASHTLLAYPIISSLGVLGNEAVVVTIGATIFTDIASLSVLAVCVAIHAGNFTIVKLLILLGLVAVYSAAVLFGLDWAGREFFRRTGNNEGNQFLFVLLALFLASLGAQLIGVEKIVGAFLAGLAVNDVVGDGPVKDKVVFVGSVLFIPIFFVSVGLIINIPAFIQSIASVWLTLALVCGPVLGKLAAAFLTKLIYRYKWREMLTMWSLSLPQVAATLAATLVGYRAGLLPETVLNSVIVLIVVTSTLGPILTSRVAVGLQSSPTNSPNDTPEVDGEKPSVKQQFKVVVPVYNPQNEQHLMEMAALVARHEAGKVVPLVITQPNAHMDAPQLETAFQQGELLLERAMEVSREMGVEAQALLRIDDDVAQAISRASREQNASLIVMGWSQRTGFRARLFGNVIDSVLWASHCPVAVTRLLDSPMTVKRILVPVDNLTAQAVQPLRFAQILAEVNNAQVTLLHICDRRTSTAKIAWNRSQLTLLASKWVPESKLDIQIIPHDDVAKVILNTAKPSDLVVLRSKRLRTAGGLTISDRTTQLLRQLTCSLVMLGEPQRAMVGVPSTQPRSTAGRRLVT